jgi:hypothetical protein
VLVYVTETKFYRQYLGISYEFGSYLRKRKALSVDAETDDGRPLFRLDLVEGHRAEITAYRARLREFKETLVAL